jgi:hypothetical protein
MGEGKEWSRAIANVILSGGISTDKPVSHDSHGLVHKSDGTYDSSGNHISSNPNASGDDGTGRNSD